MTKILALFLLTLGLSHSVLGYPEEDIVKELPGYAGELKSRWFSGYVNISSPSKPNLKLAYHYIHIEAENDPENAPLLLWTNGGPGASSLWGLFTEIGPVFMSEDSLKTEAFLQTGIPTLFDSNTSWTKLANVLIMTGPAPISFDYCEPAGPSADGYSCGSWNDELTAEANYHFLEGFFKKFPEYEKRNTDLYLTGESYAGIYIPTLTKQILDHEDSVAKKLLRGIAIGDGCVGRDLVCSAVTKEDNPVEMFFSAQFLFGHGQISTPVYNNYLHECKSNFEDYVALLQHDFEVGVSQLQRKVANPDSSAFRLERNLREADEQAILRERVKAGKQKCIDMYHNMRDLVGYFSVYNLYDECWDVPNLPGEVGFTRSSTSHPKYEPYPCGGGIALDVYSKQTSVKKALHIPLDARFNSGDNGVGFDYVSTQRNILPLQYHFAVDTKLRVLIYNGDVDHDLNSFFAEWWVNTLGLEKLEQWRAWTLDGKQEVVGYTERYEGDYNFVTIRGSGHMTPQMKPRATYEMIKQWLNKEPLKQYSP